MILSYECNGYHKLFQKVKENYFISILDSTSPLPKKSIEISTKFKFNERVYG